MCPDEFLRLRVGAKGDATVVECSGRLTADVAAILKNEVRDLIPRSKRIVIDLTDLTSPLAPKIMDDSYPKKFRAGDLPKYG